TSVNSTVEGLALIHFCHCYTLGREDKSVCTLSHNEVKKIFPSTCRTREPSGIAPNVDAVIGVNKHAM
ncbi:MAG: hypothetical protein WC965_14030, partial [Thiohalomonadaceae bacterium]